MSKLQRDLDGLKKDVQKLSKNYLSKDVRRLLELFTEAFSNWAVEMKKKPTLMENYRDLVEQHGPLDSTMTKDAASGIIFWIGLGLGEEAVKEALGLIKRINLKSSRNGKGMLRIHQYSTLHKARCVQKLVELV